MEIPVGRNVHPVRTFGRRRNLLSILFAILLAASIPLAALAYPLERIFFRPAPLLAALERHAFYQEYPRLLLDFGAAGGDLLLPGLGSGLLQSLLDQRAEEALRLVFAPEWVRAQTQQLTFEFYGYANFERDSLDLALDLREPRRRLTAGEVQALIIQGMAAWPDCTLEDGLAAAIQAFQNKSALLPRCKPPAEWMTLYRDALQTGLDALVGRLPERLQLVPPPSSPAGGIYALIRWTLRLSPLAPLLLLAAAAALLRGSLRALCAWSGPPLYIGGLSGLLSVGLLLALTLWLVPLPAGIMPPPVAEIYQFLAGVFLTLWQAFLLIWAVSCAACSAAGWILIMTATRANSRQTGLTVTSW